MSIAIDAAFDGGNILVLGGGPAVWELAIAKDRQSDFYQWFYFRVVGAAGRALTLRLGNAGGAAYPYAWPGYHARWSEDGEDWRCAQSDYADGVLTIRHTPASDSCAFAYFAPYPLERHRALLMRAAAVPGVRARVLGTTLDGRAIDCLELGEAGPALWLYARQHPGETMAQWWMEGVIERLIDPADPVARALRARAQLFLVPNMNPDGSARGHLRTNAAGINLNRVWHAPDPRSEPEVACVLARMDETGVDLAIDAHGDEAIPHVFIAGFEGIPAASERQRALYARYVGTLARLTPDFQTSKGYAPAKPGEGNMTMSTNALAQRFGCPAFTLEMPFKDHDDLPDPLRGWSPARSKALGRDCLAALLELLPELR